MRAHAPCTGGLEIGQLDLRLIAGAPRAEAARRDVAELDGDDGSVRLVALVAFVCVRGASTEDPRGENNDGRGERALPTAGKAAARSTVAREGR